MKEEIYQMIKDKMKVLPNFHKLQKETKEDIIQDTYLNIWEKVLDGTLIEDIDQMENYIFISCRNNVLKELRIKNRERYIEDTKNLPDRIYDTSIIEEKILFEERREFILSNINIPIDKEIYRMRLNNVKVKTISKELNIGEKKIESIINSNNRYLKNLIKKKENKLLFRGRYSYQAIDINTNHSVIYNSLFDVAKAIKKCKMRLSQELKDNDYIIHRNFLIKKVIKN